MTGPRPLANPKWWTLALAGVGVVALATGIAIIDALPVGVFHDDAMYVILARSLATGHGYRYLNLPGAPVATQHPPGFPALLALVSWFAPAFPANLTVFKALNAVLSAISAVLITVFARGRALDAPWAVGLGLVAAVSIPTLVLSSMLLSEPLFMLLVISLLLAIERFVEGDRPMPRRALLIGIGIAACALVRLNGIALLPATLIVLALRRRWTDGLLTIGAAVVAMSPWQIMVATHTGKLPMPLRGDYESASSWLSRGLHAMGPRMIFETIGKTVPDSARMFAVLFSPFPGNTWHALALLALLALALAGVAAAWRRMPVALLFLAGYFTIVALWPFEPARFLWAIWPLVLMLVAAGAFTGASRVVASRGGASAERSIVSWALVAAFVWAGIGYGMYEVRGVRGKWWGSVARANGSRIAAEVTWVNANTASDELIASEDEGAIFLYTGRRTVPDVSVTPDAYLRDIPPAESAREGLLPILAAYPVTMVVAGSRKTVETADLLTVGRSPLLQRGIDFPGGVAYRVIRRP